MASSLSGKSGGRATITALCADFHDLRHAGNQFVVQARANLSELMETHGSRHELPALIYLHSTDARQRALADAVAERAQEPNKNADPTPAIPASSTATT